jgi:hypothetical protein
MPAASILRDSMKNCVAPLWASKPAIRPVLRTLIQLYHQHGSR